MYVLREGMTNRHARYVGVCAKLLKAHARRPTEDAALSAIRYQQGRLWCNNCLCAPISRVMAGDSCEDENCVGRYIPKGNVL